MKKLLIALCALSSIFFVYGKEITIVDSSDSSVLPSATVIGQSGLIMGITDERGRIENPPFSQYPLSIRSIGYEPTNVAAYSDTVRLVPAVYSLNEVVINQGERPIKRVVCFAREYATGATGADTMQLYAEYMLESFIKDPKKKVKGYKDYDETFSIRNAKRYGRLMNAAGLDSVFKPKGDDDITMLSWRTILSYPQFKITEDVAKAGRSYSDTIMGKYGPGKIYRKQNGIFTFTTDLLSEYKDHKWSPWFFKLLGMTMDVEKMQSTLAYKESVPGEYTPDDFIYQTHSIGMLARGKMFKKMFHTDKPIEMNSYIELYPISVTYLTPEEYKEIRSEPGKLPFKTPLNLQPLPTPVQALMDRANGLAK